MPEAAIIKKRQKQIAARVQQAGLDGLLTADPANVSYLTGFQGHDAWALTLANRCWLLTDSRYTEQARQECAGCTILQRKTTLADEAARIIARQKNKITLALDNKISLALQQILRKKVRAALKPLGNIIEPVRSIKEPDEIKLIRKAVKVNQTALDAALNQLRIGMTENEMAGILELEIRKRGGRMGFETIVCFGPNGSRNHHIPGPRKLRKNDVILIDYGTAINNYTCDMTRCFGVNQVSKEYARAYQTVAAAHQAAIQTIKDGVLIAEVDQAARAAIARQKFPVYGHGTGHGIGLDIHELPFLGPKNSDTLKTNQILTIEPGIYLPGKWGIRIEDDILVTPKGAKILTTSTLPSTLTILKVK